MCVSDGIGCGYFSVFFLRTGRLLKSVLKVNFGPWMVLVVVTSTWFDFQKVKSEQNVWFVGLRNTTFFMTSNPQSTAIIIIIIIMVVIYAEELVMFSYPLPPPQVRSFSNLEVCPNEIQRRK